jgi:hypothetical protein
LIQVEVAAIKISSLSLSLSHSLFPSSFIFFMVKQMKSKLKKYKTFLSLSLFTSSPLCTFSPSFYAYCLSLFFLLFRWLSTHFSLFPLILFVNFNFHFYSLFTREESFFFVLLSTTSSIFFFCIFVLFNSLFCFFMFSRSRIISKETISTKRQYAATNNKLKEIILRVEVEPRRHINVLLKLRLLHSYSNIEREEFIYFIYIFLLRIQHSNFYDGEVGEESG